MKDVLSSIFKIKGLVLLCLFFSNCNLENPEIGFNIDEIITLEFENNDQLLLADGKDQVKVIANLGPLADANQVITFFTTDGKFAEAIDPDTKQFQVTTSGKRAEATLISSINVSDFITVSAKVGDFVTTKTLKFERSFPDELILKVTPAKISANLIESGQVSVELWRNLGEPSNGTKVFLKLTPKDTAEADVPEFVIAQNNEARSSITSKNGKPGKVLLTAIVYRAPNDSISQSKEILFE